MTPPRECWACRCICQECTFDISDGHPNTPCYAQTNRRCTECRCAPTEARRSVLIWQNLEANEKKLRPTGVNVAGALLFTLGLLLAGATLLPGISGAYGEGDDWTATHWLWLVAAPVTYLVLGSIMLLAWRGMHGGRHVNFWFHEDKVLLSWTNYGNGRYLRLSCTCGDCRIVNVNGTVALHDARSKDIVSAVFHPELLHPNTHKLALRNLDRVYGQATGIARSTLSGLSDSYGQRSRAWKVFAITYWTIFAVIAIFMMMGAASWSIPLALRFV